MNSDRLIVQKYFQRGLTGGQVFRHVEQLGITRNGVYRIISRLCDTGSIQGRPRTGRPRTFRSKKRIKRIREKIRRNPERSARKLAMEEDIDNRSMRGILKIDLDLKPYKNVNCMDYRRSKRWLGLKDKYNCQNDRIYALSIEDIPENIRTVQRFQHSGSTIVWGAVSYNDKIPLKFIEQGVKINPKHYQNEILRSTLMPNITKSTQQWLVDNCPDFISSEERPASSPDLNPLDYSIWETLETIVNANPITVWNR
ncbi:unnamed protein product [Rotaria magnacalcarata]|uniref:Uncharacterized protein n=1 Tax=Rotaria magnacalcarata TaxID=392030 RepID=A0A819SRC4_9BILA|nr:unnamed protein product [Rotaria magnacalcarata]